MLATKECLPERKSVTFYSGPKYMMVFTLHISESVQYQQRKEINVNGFERLKQIFFKLCCLFPNVIIQHLQGMHFPKLVKI